MKVALVIALLLTHGRSAAVSTDQIPMIGDTDANLEAGESTAPKHRTGPADQKAAATAVIRKQGGSLSSWQTHDVEFNGASQLHKGSPGHKGRTARSTNEKTGGTLAHVANRLHREAHVTQPGSSGTSGQSEVTQAATVVQQGGSVAQPRVPVQVVNKPANKSTYRAWNAELSPGQVNALRQQFLTMKDQAWEPGVACIVPMWNREEYVCREYIQVGGNFNFVDYRGNRRIFLPHRSDCTVECPKRRWYQVPEIDVITCDDGVWRNPSGLLTPEVDCITSAEATQKGLGAIVLCVVGICGCIACNIRSWRKADTKTQECYQEQVKAYKAKFKQEEAVSMNGMSRSASQATLGASLRRPSFPEAPGSSSASAAQEAPGSSSDAAAQEAVPTDPSQLALGTRPGRGGR